MSQAPEANPLLRQTVEQALHNLAPEADLARLHPQRSLREQLDLDSFDFLQLLIGLQQRLGVSVPERDYRQVDSLEGLIAHLAGRAGEAQAEPLPRSLPGAHRPPQEG